MKPMKMNMMVMAVCGVMAASVASADWPNYRGAGVAELPASLPKGKWEPLWKEAAMGKCHAGIAVAEGAVLVPDHGKGKDWYRAFDAETGKELWKRDFENDREMDYGPGPRATPLIYKGKAYVVSAFGEVYCFDLKTGKTIWNKAYAKDFGAEDPTMWGFTTSPFEAGGNVILFPDAIVALKPDTGETVWSTRTKGASYATPIVGKFGGVEQIVGLDAGSLNGWDIKTGKRLWGVDVSAGQGWICPSPVRVGDKVFIAHEGEGAKLFGFGEEGKVNPKPLGENEEMAHDTFSPAAFGDLVLGPSAGLMCLDATDGLKKLWTEDEDDLLGGVQHIIPGKNHVLVVSESGEVGLLSVNKEGATILGKHKLSRGSLSFPAIAGGRLYIRDDKFIYCYDFTGKTGAAPKE